MTSRAPSYHAVLVAVAIVAGALLLCIGYYWVEGRGRSYADAAAKQAAQTHAGLLGSEMQKFRLLPLVLGQSPDVAAALAGDRRAADGLNRTLETLAERTDAAAIYAIDAGGHTIAASNWRLPTTFVGRNYAFRPYFTDAMRSGGAELFALGTVSGRPGLYLARRVDGRGRRLGAIVVKVEFDSVEAGWARTPGATIVTDRHGVILVTSIPAWRFGATTTLDQATVADARQTLQFGAGPPRRAPLRIEGRDAFAEMTGVIQRYRIASEPAPLAGATLMHLAPLAPSLAAARLQALLWVCAILIVLGTFAAIAMRNAETRRMQSRARALLEEEVARRTAELRDANARLIVESNERFEADRRFRAAREELAQANRLGTLGLITAGIAHEINQPIAAIRSFAENGLILLDREAKGRTRDNLLHIVDLTDRVGTITRELRAFARRRQPSSTSTTLGAVVDGTMLLMSERARGRVRIEIDPALRATSLVGDRVRLEQIIINLVQNAIDAVTGREGGIISIRAAPSGNFMELEVADNGSGLDPAIADTLFTPFASAKVDGLGLGLAIARDIAREFGGDIRYSPADTGAKFVATFRTA